MRYRVAVGSILTESNQFTDKVTTLADFERTELRRGADILEVDAGVIGGMLSALRERDLEILPLIVATAVPGGVLTSECYQHLKGELLASLKATLPVDAVLLGLHGAAAVADEDDLEGNLLEATRELVGPQVPVIVTLDLHAHVTGKMVQHADALLAWETYPHKDSFMTGCRSA